MTRKKSQFTTPAKAILGALALAVLFAFGAPQAALAAGTSGGATIYNTVKVTYSSGTQSAFAYASNSITVNTQAAAPTVTVPADQNGIAGANFSYSYTVKSNSNGTDTYNTSNLKDTPDANQNASTGDTITGSVQLWGGIALGSGTGTITVPYGTTGSLVPNTSIVQIGSDQYTVTGVTAGTAASTDSSTGDLIPETPDTIALSSLNGAPPITAGSVANGTQVGEVKTVTVSFKAGAPIAAGTDGTYTTTFDVASAQDSSVTASVTGAKTTIYSPKLTITKTADKTTANPGGIITYTITVTNTSATTQATSVTVTDPVPAYTTYVTGTTTLNGTAVPDDASGNSALKAGLNVGSLAANTSAIIKYQVKVD